MTEIIPEIKYSELKRPFCSKCKDHLEMDDPGVWYCMTCDYEEYNNITFCQSDFCDNLVKASSVGILAAGWDLEDIYCQVERERDDIPGFTCLGAAKSEADADEAEHLSIMEHKRGCSNPECECRNY